MKKIYAILALALISFWNAVYLTFAAYNLQSQLQNESEVTEFFCDVSDVFSCSNLFLQDFAWMFGIPFSAIAMLVYPIIFILAFIGMSSKNKNYFKAIWIMAIWWMMFNGYIIFHELMIPIICLACLACSIAIATIAILSYRITKDPQI